MRFLVPSVAALVPLIITPGLLSYFDVTPKIAILLLGAALGCCCWGENARNVRAFVGSPAGCWFAALVGAEWLSATLATVFSLHPELSLNGGIWRRFGLISLTGLLLFGLLAAAWLAAGGENIRRFLRACAVSGALTAVYGIFQYFGWDPLLPAKAYQVGEGSFTIVRPPGTLGHADYFAAWLVVVAFFGAALARLEQAQWRKIAALVVSALAALAILLSGTRAAILGLVCGAIVLAIAGRSRIRIRGLALALACIAGLAGLLFSPAGAKLRARVQWSLEDFRGGARLLLWRDSLRMASHRPWSGYGPETFATEFPRFESIALARAYPDFYHESPHNIFLDTLASQGVLGLAVMLGLCGLALWAARRLWRSGHQLAAPLAAALAGTLVCQQFSVFIVATALYFYLLLAVLVACATAPTGNGRTLSPFVLATVLAVGFYCGFYAIRLSVADRNMAVAYRQIEFGNVNAAADAYRAALRWQPFGAGPDLSYSRAMQQMAGRMTVGITRLQAERQAMEAGVRAAITAEDRQNAWYNLAQLFAGQNDAVAVERSLRNAIAWAPNWFKPHWALAQLLEMTDRHDAAVAEAHRALECDGGRDPEVAESLRRLLR